MDVTRVAFDIGPLSGPRTGVGTAVGALCDALAADPSVTLLPYITSFRARPQEGVRRLPFPAAFAHRAWRGADWPGADRPLGDFDVIHGTNYVVPPSAHPRLVSVYDCWFLRQPSQATGDVRRAGAVLRRAIAHGATVHASSHATAATVRELFPSALVEVIHLAATPLPAPAPEPPIPEIDGGGYVLSVGTLERRKNLPRLVTAFAHVARELPELRLVLAGGNGDDARAVDDAIDAVGPEVAARVLRTGYVDDATRSWLMHHAAVLAYPSLDEGFGFPLLDAMQARVPIVATRVGSIPEVAGDAALLSEPTDVEGLAHHLVSAVASTETRAGLVEAGSRQLRAFSWSETARGMSALYHRLHHGITAA
jgi:glycosyltransferase involved in cell wall biosynthesis